MSTDSAELQNVVSLDNVSQGSSVLTAKDSIRAKRREYQKHREKRLSLPAEVRSIVSFSTSRSELVSGQVVNLSRFGARVQIMTGDSCIEVGETINDVRISIEGVEVFCGSAVVVSHLNGVSSNEEFGLSLNDDGLDLEKVNAILDLQPSDSEAPSISTVKSILALCSQVKPEFKVLVSDLNTFFQDLRRKLSEEEAKIMSLAHSESYRKKLEDHTITLGLSLFREDIHRFFDQFAKLVDTFSNDETIIHKRYFRANFHPAMLGAPFVNRSWSKPLGHAGDYGLMVMLYEYDDIGQSLFEKFFHRFCCNEPAAVANKNRVDLLSALIAEEYQVQIEKRKSAEFKISSVACGPAKEIELYLNQATINKELPVAAVCIDQEGEALDYAINRLRAVAARKRNVTVTFLKEDAVMGLIRKKAFTEEVAGSSVITCAGLYDYVSDRLASKLIESFYSLLAPGGLLLIGNVSDQNPDRFSMDYFMEWNLILRSPNDLLALVPKEISENKKNEVSVISEPLGLNLFLAVRKAEGG
ncbi:MAG: class I SAM-dependent methyltransferase [Deltaproteobacteria bacterium]|nr:class I SAM-dependent methyltransferase [Deltaproteobacteria bacterium]